MVISLTRTRSLPGAPPYEFGAASVFAVASLFFAVSGAVDVVLEAIRAPNVPCVVGLGAGGNTRVPGIRGTPNERSQSA